MAVLARLNVKPQLPSGKAKRHAWHLANHGAGGEQV
jgi:hypothetical protein